MTSSIQPRIQPRIQRIQAAINQANIEGQIQESPAANGQSLVCSFEIAGRRQEGYLGVNSIAEVTPPWFPKDAFQVRGRRDKPTSPIITLKRTEPAGAKTAIATGAIAPSEPTQSSVPSPIQSSISVDVFQAVAGGEREFVQEELPLDVAPYQSSPEDGVLASAPVTAEILADLFEQADPLSGNSTAAQSVNQPSQMQAYDPDQKQPHKAILAPVSPTEQAAAEALAQSLSQSLEKSLDSSSDGALAQPIKPIEAVAPPALPRPKSPELSSHNNSTNPMLPLELLQNIGQEVIVWQEALKEVHQKIQTLYQEGPILSGWLEKHSDAGVYQLCGLDPTGQSWRRPCHPDQLHAVGLAIGRYKQLRLLLGEKQRLDQRIKRLSETLTMLRLRLRAY